MCRAREQAAFKSRGLGDKGGGEGRKRKREKQTEKEREREGGARIE